MAQDLKILITGSLNKTTSIAEINRALGQIEKDPSLNKVTIGVNVNTQQVIDSIKQISNQIKSLQNSMSNMNMGSSFSANQDKLTQSLKNMYNQGLVNEKFFQNFNKVINGAKNVEEINKVSSALQRVSDYAKNVNLQQSLLSQAQGLLSSGSNSRNFNEINQIAQGLNNINPAAQDATRQLTQFRNQLSQYDNTIQQAQSHTMTFGAKLKEALSGFALWSMTATLIYTPIRALEDMTQRLIQIDTQMTDIKRVMDEPNFKFTQMLQDAVSTSDQLSSKLTDVLSIMDNFGRMGFNDSQLTSITKTAQVLQNISDLNASDSVDTLTSAMLNFNIASQDSINIADKLNEVDNHYAITTQDLADSIRKTAATAKTFGVTLDQLNGYTAAIGSTTRETGAVIGNGLKTIFSRITTAKPAIDALQSVGISIHDLQGQVKPVSDILGELAGKWNKLSAEQQQNVGVNVASRFQLTRFLALMNNWQLATDATTTSINSQGSAMKEQEKYSDSLQARLNRLDTAWNKLVLAFGQAIVTDGLVAGIESLNSLATAVATVTKYVGVLPGVFATVGVAMVALSAKFRAFSTAIMFGTGALTEQQMALTGLTAEMTLTDIATRTFTISLRGIMVASGVGLVLAGLGFVLEKLVGNFADAQKAQEDFKSEQQKGVDALTTNKQQTEQLIKEYEKLSSIKNDSSKAWNTDDEQKYIQVQNQLAQIYPQLVSFMDGAGNAHLKNKQQIDKEIESTNKLIEAQNNLTKANAADDIKKSISDMNSLQNQMKAKKNNIQLGFNSVKDFLLPSFSNPLGMSDKQKAQNQSDIVNLQKKWSDASQQINSKILTISGAYNKLKIDPTIQKSVDDYVSSLDLSKVKDPTKLEDYAKKVADLTDKMQQAYKSGDKSGFNDARDSLANYTSKMVDTDSTASKLKLSLNDVKKATDAMKNAVYSGKDGLDGLDTSLSDTTDTASTLSDKLNQAKGDFNSLKDVIMEMVKAKQYDQAITASQNEAYSALSDSISPVNKMLEDLANGQQLSASSAMDLIQKVPEMTKYLSIENGQVKVNTQGVLDWRDAQIASFQDMINAEKAQIDAQSKGLKTKLANYGVEIKAILSVAEANQALADAEAQHQKNADAINKSNAPGAMHASMVEDSQYQSVISGVNKIKDIYNSLDSLSSMASTGLNQVGTSMEKTSSSTEQSTYVTDKYKQSMDQLTNALEKLKNLQQQYPNYSKSYRDALQQEINLLQQQKDLTDDQSKNLQSQIASGNILQTGMITTKSGGSSSSSSSNYNYASGGSTAAQVWNFFKGKGLSDSAIAGIMGNLQQESGLSTTARNPNGATGIAQWMGGRLSNLQSQSNWSSLDTQLNFLWSEWQSMMPSSFNSLNSTQSAYMFEKLFERSGGSALSSRENYANQFYSQFAGKGGTYTGGNAPSGSTSSGDASNLAAQQAQAADQAKSDLLNLQQTSSNLQSQIQDIYLQIVQSQTAYYDHVKSTYDAQLAQYDYLQNVEDKNSNDWLQTQIKRESAYQNEIKNEQDSIDYLNQQIAYNNQLNEAQKATLSDDVLQRQQDLLSIEQKLYDTRSQMANEIVDTYKQALQDMKDAATKNIDNMINDINKAADQANYQKKLQDAQKSAQDIQDEINKLMLDDSASAKKRVADLQKQLSDQQDSIAQTIADNDKQTRIDNLNAQKDSISAYYDNLMNDQDKFTQIQKDILNINNQNVIDSLNSLSTQVKQNVNLLGTSVVNTLIDAVNRANGYMNLTTQNSGAIGHITSLDTGGYTGNFGSSGKLAMLHEKEIVLNKTDTSNFLKAISYTRDLFNNLVKIPNLSGVISSPATAGSNVYNINMNIDKLTGDANGAKQLLSSFVTGVKRLGGNI